jgi:hypothetical protein
MFPQHMTAILAQEAFDATVKFLNSFDVMLAHDERPWVRRFERRDCLSHCIIPRNIGYQIFYQGKGFHGTHSHFFSPKFIQPGLAQKARLTIDFGTA